MRGRNVESRIIKLEERRQRPREILVVWRLPGADVEGAIAEADFHSGDKVICAEWFGSDPLPASRWYKERLSSAMAPRDYGYVMNTIGRLVQELPDADLSCLAPTSLVGLTDNELLHIALGV